MEAIQTAETQLMHDVEMLRTRYVNTQELYREVCAVMFFRYGLTPTANRLYQLVRKGSMSAPAEALAKFWSQLRERSRVTIEGPDLPDALRTGAGELVSALWKQAQEAAAASLAVLRDEAQAQVALARQAATAAREDAAAALAELQSVRAALAAARQEMDSLAHQLGASEALQGKLRQRVDDARKELNEQHAWFKTVERDHAAALDKLHGQLRAAHDAADTARARAAHELEHERAQATKLQEALAAAQEAAAASAERHRGELRETLSQMSGLHQQIGVLEGSAAAAAIAREGIAAELAAARREIVTVQEQAAAATGRATALEKALYHSANRLGPATATERGPAD